jgi:hypothetical protein
MSSAFTPFLKNRSDGAPADAVAYIRVRVPGEPRADGSMVVYLPDGTGLVVNVHQLLHFNADPSSG